MAEVNRQPYLKMSHCTESLGVEKEHDPRLLTLIELKTTPNWCINGDISATTYICASKAHNLSFLRFQA